MFPRLQPRLSFGRTPGFTLVELLVVIAVTALLAAVLFPVFAQAREKARQAACLSNLSQIGRACLLYSQDFDELEVPQSVAYGVGGTTYWPTLLTPYISSIRTTQARTVFSCPSAAASSTLAVAPDPRYIHVGTGIDQDFFYGGATGGDYSSPGGSTTAGQLSYSLNCIYNDLSTAAKPGGWKSTTWPLTAGKLSTPHFGFTKNTNSTLISGNPVAVSEVEDPASTIHIVDAMIGRNNVFNTANLGASIGRITREGSTDMNTDAEDAKPTYRHNGGFNALYGDGHAHWRKFGTTRPCEWSIQADICP